MAAPPITTGGFADPSKAPEQAWSTGLFDCCQDCYVFCTPAHVQYGENVRKLNNTAGFCGPCMLYYCCSCFSCCFAGSTRGDIRRKYSLKADPCSDCCVHMFCSPCAVCQESREVRRRMGWVTWPEH